MNIAVPIHSDLVAGIIARLFAARTRTQINDTSKEIWRIWSEGLLSDQAVETLSPVIEQLTARIREYDTVARRAPGVPHTESRYKEHRRKGIPDEKRAASWLRRKRLAKDCPIPTHIARDFTTGELAVLAVLSQAHERYGRSDMSLPEIAARAGVGCTLARLAIRKAVKRGLLLKTENKKNGWWNHANTIRIIARRWIDWITQRIQWRGTMKKEADSDSHPQKTHTLRKVSPTPDKYIDRKQDKPAYSISSRQSGPPKGPD